MARGAGEMLLGDIRIIVTDVKDVASPYMIDVIEQVKRNIHVHSLLTR